MEFLGDSIMQLVATEYLFIHFPDHHEGHLTVRLPSIMLPGKARVGWRLKLWEQLVNYSGFD